MKHNSTDKILALIAHLGFFTGIGYFFAPLVIWLFKKDSEFVSHHAKQAMVWQGGMAILGSLFSLIGFAIMAATIGVGMIFVVPALLLFTFLTLIPSLIGASKVFSDENYVYPVLGVYAEKL